MKRLLFLLVLGPSLAWAQSTANPPPGGSIILMCVYNTVVPAPTPGQPFYIQCDGNGRIR